MQATYLRPLPGALVLLAMAFTSHAAQPAHQCAQLTDDVLRLACYDAAFGKPGVPARAALPAAAPAAPAVQAAAPAAPVAAAPVAAVPPRPQPAPAEAARAAAEKEPTATFTAAVKSVRQMADRRLSVTLDNGQVWQQLEAIGRLELDAGDRVTIRPGSFNSFTLESPDGLRTKVRLAQ